MTWFGATVRNGGQQTCAEGVPSVGDVVALRLVPGRLYAVARHDDGYRVALAEAGDGPTLAARAQRISASLGLVAGGAPNCWTLPD